MNILEKIAEVKRCEVEAMKRLVAEKDLKVEAFSVLRTVVSMSRSIKGHNPAIIAEHKRRSPSKGEIHPMSRVDEIARAYSEGGAAAMSVLTDTPFFGGSTVDLAVARVSAPRLPLLRKEFIVDEYQLYQSRILGADAVLLIAAMIDKDSIRRLNDTAHSLGLETLVEIHDVAELDAVPEDADMVGVNNRDLTTFSTDIDNSSRLADMMPEGIVKVAESGIKTPQDVLRLKEKGFDAFLIGEAFMSQDSPGCELRRFLTEGRR